MSKKTSLFGVGLSQHKSSSWPTLWTNRQIWHVLTKLFMLSTMCLQNGALKETKWCLQHVPTFHTRRKQQGAYSTKWCKRSKDARVRWPKISRLTKSAEARNSAPTPSCRSPTWREGEADAVKCRNSRQRRVLDGCYICCRSFQFSPEEHPKERKSSFLERRLCCTLHIRKQSFFR